MKKISALLTFLILVGIFIPAVSATNVYELPYSDSKNLQTYSYYTAINPNDGTYVGNSQPTYYIIDITNIENYANLHYARFTAEYNMPFEVGNHPFQYMHPVTQTKTDGYYICHKYTNLLGGVVKTDVVFFFTGWNIGSRTGQYKDYIYNASGGRVSHGSYNQVYYPADYASDDDIQNRALIYIDRMAGSIYNLTSEFSSYADNKYSIDISEYPSIAPDNFKSAQINITREFNGEYYQSDVGVYNNNSQLIIGGSSSSDESYLVYLSDLYKITVTSQLFDEEYYFLLGQTPGDPGDPTDPADPDNTSVTVYVRNSQSGALIANAHIVISASVNGTFHEIVNETVPSGIYSIELQPTGGGMPNPDFYRLTTIVEGYNSIMPNIDFEVDGATSIYAYLDPVAGAPEDENKTFIDFYVRDLAANAISGATVNFGGYTLITNSAGYAVFEVDKSNTYSWTISKSGYGALTGNAVIGDAPRHTINTVLAPAVTPTTPTPIPTSTPISPTPAMTAPTGEPVSNWLEWFAAHFGMILGGGAEIGKIFMWLCFSIPVGVYVGKESKAGAAGFMAGAGVVTLFFVLIGWVPIWLLVFIALIIGLLYAKIFNNSDNGGGR